MKAVLADTIRETGRRGELEQDKLYCLLLDVQEKMRQELAENPTYGKNFEFERLQYITESYRGYIRQGRDLFDQLSGWLQRIDGGVIPKHTEGIEDIYPKDAFYYMAVAEQERDLERLHPNEFGVE